MMTREEGWTPRSQAKYWIISSSLEEGTESIMDCAEKGLRMV